MTPQAPTHSIGHAAAAARPASPADRKLLTLIDCLRRRGQAPRRILVVGCGSGVEAGGLARAFDAEAVGIDLPGSSLSFDRAGAAPARLACMDAERLAFADATFDLVYSFHALEHMAAPGRALEEMRRVLGPGGGYCVGTPNSSRLVGYVGSDAPLSARIRWNLQDLRMRLSGRWSNAEGAHAGFRAAELSEMCRRTFGSAEDISDDYYAGLYSRHDAALRLLRRSGAKALLYPCVYVTGRRA